MEVEKLKRAVIKEEFVTITKDFILAVILNQFIYWSDRVNDFDKMIEEERNNLAQFSVLEKMRTIKDQYKGIHDSGIDSNDLTDESLESWESLPTEDILPPNYRYNSIGDGKND